MVLTDSQETTDRYWNDELTREGEMLASFARLLSADMERVNRSVRECGSRT